MNKGSIHLTLITALFVLCLLTTTHTDHSVVAEAQFYGVPTFGYNIDSIEQHSEEVTKLTEGEHDRFWGVMSHNSK